MPAAAETDADARPTSDDLLAFRDFADAFSEPDFHAGERVSPYASEDGVVQIGWWSQSATVSAWEQALYDNHIVDPSSDYLARGNVAFTHEALADPSVLARIGLPKLRRVLTFLVRAERHSEGGWFEPAFESGMAQAATRRLVTIGRRISG